MRKEIDFGQGRTLVLEDCGPNQFVISMLADYQVQEGAWARDRLTGRAIKYSTCLTGFHMVDVLKEAVDEWYKGNEENKLPPPKMPSEKCGECGFTSPLHAVSCSQGAFEQSLKKETAPSPAPVPMLLHCPICQTRHIDEGEFATKEHHTHACQGCGHVWRPAVGPTVDVQFLPGFKNPPVVDLREEVPRRTPGERLADLEKKAAMPEHLNEEGFALAAAVSKGFKELEARVRELEMLMVHKKSLQEDLQKSLQKELKWYRVTFKGEEVFSALEVSPSRPECRDWDDATHVCIRQASSLRQAIKVSEFERQFGGCKKNTVSG
jgi:hypothetical protein